MKNIKIFNFTFSKTEINYTCQIYHPFLLIEVINNYLNNLFLYEMKYKPWNLIIFHTICYGKSSKTFFINEHFLL